MQMAASPRLSSPQGAGPTSSIARLRNRANILLAAATTICYFERTGFAIAFTAAADHYGYSQNQKGRVLGVFFWGYLSTQLLGGALARRYGGMPVLVVATCSWALLSYLSPFDPKRFWLLVVCRVGIGISQGVLFPALHTQLVEQTEQRTRAYTVSLVVSCIYLGAALAMVFTPRLTRAFGARAQLVVSASLGLGWSLCARARFCRPPTVTQPSKPPSGFSDVPWRAMALSPAVIAIMLSSLAFHIVYFALMSWVPTFVSHALRVDLDKVGVAVKAGPWVLMYALCVVAGRLSDELARRYGARLARKTLTVSGLLAATPPLLLLARAASAPSAFACIALSLCACAFSRGGFSVNHMDIGPRFAGVLLSFSNTAGTLGGTLATEIGGAVLQGRPHDRDAWATFFAILSAVCVASAGLYAVCAEGDRVLFGDESGHQPAPVLPDIEHVTSHELEALNDEGSSVASEEDRLLGRIRDLPARIHSTCSPS